MQIYMYVFPTTYKVARSTGNLWKTHKVVCKLTELFVSHEG